MFGDEHDAEVSTHDEADFFEEEEKDGMASPDNDPWDESGEEHVSRGFSSKIEGSERQNGNIIASIQQKIRQHCIRIGFI